MRAFTDAGGRQWDVVVGRESWGAFVALFVPKSHNTDVRQTLMQAASQEAAYDELSGMDEAALRALLDRSKPKDE
jgi:hypothetical protein